MQDELSPLERQPQPHVQLRALAQLRLHLRIEEAQAVAPGILGLIHGQIGSFQRLLSALAGMLAEQGHADARRAAILRRLQGIRLAELGQQPHGEALRLPGRLERARPEVAEQHHELVAGQAGHGIAVAHPGEQARGHLLEQAVALVMADGVVDRLEVIQIDEQQRPQAPLPLAGALRLFQTPHEQAPVGQAGQGVEERQAPDLLLGGHAGGDVAQRRHVMGDLPGIVADRTDGQHLRVLLAALAPVPHLALPGAGGLDGMPHRRVEGGIVTAGAEHARLPADGLLGAVAGDFREGRVDAQDDLLGIGDQHAHLGIEGRGGDALVLGGPLALADVAGRREDVALAVQLDQAETDLRRIAAAVLAPVQGFDDELLLPPARPGQGIANRLDADVRLPAGQMHADDLLQRIAEHAAERVAGLHHVALQVEDMDAVAGVLQQHLAAPVGPLAGGEQPPQQPGRAAAHQQEQHAQDDGLAHIVAPLGEIVLLAEADHDEGGHVRQPAIGAGAPDPVGRVVAVEGAAGVPRGDQPGQLRGAADRAGPSGLEGSRRVAGDQRHVQVAHQRDAVRPQIQPRQQPTEIAHRHGGGDHPREATVGMVVAAGEYVHPQLVDAAEQQLAGQRAVLAARLVGNEELAVAVAGRRLGRHSVSEAHPPRGVGDADFGDLGEPAFPRLQQRIQLSGVRPPSADQLPLQMGLNALQGNIDLAGQAGDAAVQQQRQILDRLADLLLLALAGLAQRIGQQGGHEHVQHHNGRGQHDPHGLPFSLHARASA
ncbi:hypothetical protein D3C78_724000 [compost metagenome]